MFKVSPLTKKSVTSCTFLLASALIFPMLTVGCGESSPGGAGGVSGTAGDPGVAGAIGAAGDSSVGGAAGVGTVGTAGAAGTGSNTAGVPNPGTGAWNAPKASSIDHARLQSEYTAWKAKFYKECGNGTAFVRKDSDSDTVSEGIAYGMLITANMGDQAAFDQLWAFYKAHRNQNGVMNWRIAGCGGTSGENGATDAELDAAMALLQAAQYFGGSYQSDAVSLIQTIWTHEVDKSGCPDGIYMLKPGDAWGGCNDGGKVNPSYMAPGYYRAFAKADTANSAGWLKLASDTYAFHGKYQAGMGGLIPDWANAKTGTADGGYGYEACRSPWRAATDVAWSGEAAAQAHLKWFKDHIDSKGGVAGMAYDRNSCFYGGFALAGMAGSQADFDAYMAAWQGMMSKNMSDGGLDDNPYYQATLRVIYLLVASGQFPSTL